MYNQYCSISFQGVFDMKNSDDFLKDMGKRIHDERKKLNISQELLSEMVGVSPQTISTAELGTKGLRPENLLKISQALGVSTDYILTGEITESAIKPIYEKFKDISQEQQNYIMQIIDVCIKMSKSE